MNPRIRRKFHSLTLRLLSIQVGQPKSIGSAKATNPDNRLWTTAFFKMPIGGAASVSRTNIDGDGQADLENHGGPDKAVCCYSKDHWTYWESALDMTLPHGAFGENLTLEGCVEDEVCVGDRFRCGSAVFQVSQPRQPCWKLARRWRIKDLAARVQQTGKTGWYFRVMTEGVIEAGSDLTLMDRPFPEFTISCANQIMHDRRADRDAVRQLATCPALSESWQKSLAAG